MAERVKRNKVVSVTYYMTNESDEQLERIDIPVSVIYGRDSGLFRKVDMALNNCEVGQKIRVTLHPHEGFGEWDPDLCFADDINNVPPEFRHVGAEAEFVNDNNETKKFVVTKVDDKSVTLDANHPFAGKIMTFHITIVAVRDATEHELLYGIEQQLGPTLH